MTQYPNLDLHTLLDARRAEIRARPDYAEMLETGYELVAKAQKGKEPLSDKEALTMAEMGILVSLIASEGFDQSGQGEPTQ